MPEVRRDLQTRARRQTVDRTRTGWLLRLHRVWDGVSDPLTMAYTLGFCTHCSGRVLFLERPLWKSVRPLECPTCGSGAWRSALYPSVAYVLTEDDYIFLRVQGVRVEFPADDGA